MKEEARQTEEANEVKIFLKYLNFFPKVSVDAVGNAADDIFSVLLDPALHDLVAVGGGREEEQRLAFTASAASNHGWRVLVHKSEDFPEVFLLLLFRHVHHCLCIR